ncbi:hypothetical protein ACFU8I_41050 [Streptomyces sp. NPDC057540]|uniref:SCO2400 family protein n=1 Tax=Streptomyces sp. NPDC057540 TaxID=3346160 RepID=UPI0036A10165
MDYCHACRRHLNGALACAGCGTPVEELRYETPHIPVPTPDRGYGEPAGPMYGEPDRPAAYGEPDRPVFHEDRPEAQDGPGRPAPEHVYELDVLEPPRPAPGGRRAARGRFAPRRGRRARSRGGRTVLVGTVGLVLAAGTLSLARLALEDPPQNGAAIAVEELEATETPLSPAPVETSETPEGSSPSPVTDAPSAVPTRPRQASSCSGL